MARNDSRRLLRRKNHNRIIREEGTKKCYIQISKQRQTDTNRYNIYKNSEGKVNVQVGDVFRVLAIENDEIREIDFYTCTKVGREYFYIGYDWKFSLRTGVDADFKAYQNDYVFAEKINIINVK